MFPTLQRLELQWQTQVTVAWLARVILSTFVAVLIGFSSISGEMVLALTPGIPRRTLAITRQVPTSSLTEGPLLTESVIIVFDWWPCRSSYRNRRR